MKASTLLFSLMALLMAAPAFAAVDTNTASAVIADEESSNAMDELDPFDPNIEQILEDMDADYEFETGVPAIDLDFSSLFLSNCRRITCNVWAHVSKANQRLTLYVNGQVYGVFATSTGAKGHGTPNFDKHPDGRIYDRYTSKKFPGGDYVNNAGQRLGNMPYAVFIKGGFAIHGTGRGNWSKLGRPASHGCIRVHPDNAIIFNRLVRQYGIGNTWITVE